MSPAPPEVRASVRHALSVDVEEWFQVSAFESALDRTAWDQVESRVELGVSRLLDLFERHDAKATFFVLGRVAERTPEAVREIARRGHEIASHGYEHRRVDTLDPASFGADLDRAAAAIEAACGARVVGFRAPSFSISRDAFWAFDVLAEHGYAWSSSVFPVRHDRYGVPDFPRHPVRVATASGGSILELPMTTWRVLGRNLPAAGGGWLRALPSFVARRALSLSAERGWPGVVYVHPWEVDPDQPVLPGVERRMRVRHRIGLSRTLDRLEGLLRRFPFAPVGTVLAGLGPVPSYARAETGAAW